MGKADVVKSKGIDNAIGKPQKAEGKKQIKWNCQISAHKFCIRRLKKKKS